MLQRLKTWIFGKPRDPFDPKVYQQISLVALLAWVGLGADGLSSSCYGPEKAFLALGEHRFLALYLAVATAATVFLIASNFTHLLELFPSGGGAYLAVARLWHPLLGVTTGCALLVGYVLTIAISIAGGVDALFSMVPTTYHHWKLPVALAIVAVLTVFNLRGLKESVLSLLPVFFIFLATHALLIVAAVFQHLVFLPSVVHQTWETTRSSLQSLGAFGVLAVLVKAYSLGGGTYTGIEAVSNAVPVLREPRVETGKQTMRYMSASLAFTAAGILLAYLLFSVTPREGKTLNAVLAWEVVQTWSFPPPVAGKLFYTLTMGSESALLFVAAQAGFVGGPRVLANMALDRWLPHQLSNLSTRLVTRNAILLMTFGAWIVLILSGAAVGKLVVVYAVAVFWVFTLALGSLAIREWRRREAKWRVYFSRALAGCCVTGTILIGMAVFQFQDGALLSLGVISVLSLFCLAIHGHYRRVEIGMRRLDRNVLVKIQKLPLEPARKPKKNLLAPTAGLLVTRYGGAGLQTFFMVQKLFGRRFSNILFLSAGRIDSGLAKSDENVEELKFRLEEDLYQYVKLARRLRYYSEYRLALGTDTVVELERLCRRAVQDFPNILFFSGKLVFQSEKPWTRILHNQTALELQKRLIFQGLSLVILPIHADPAFPTPSAASFQQRKGLQKKKLQEK